MPDPVNIPSDVLKRVMRHGPQALRQWADANRLNYEAVRNGLNHQASWGNNLGRLSDSALSRVKTAETAARSAQQSAAAARAAAQTAASEAAAAEAAAAEAVGAEATSARVAAQTARATATNLAAEATAAEAAASEAAIAAGTESTAVTVAGETGVTTTAHRGSKLARFGRFFGRFLAPAVILILLAAGVYVLSNQLGRQAADDSVRPGWRIRLGWDNDREENQDEEPGPQGDEGDKPNESDSFMPAGTNKPGGAELMRQTWGDIGAGAAMRKPGTIIDLAIIERVEGTTGVVTFFDARQQQRTADVQVQSIDGGYRIQFDTGSGSISGDLKIDANTGILLGELNMPEKFGAKTKVALSPKRGD